MAPASAAAALADMVDRGLLFSLKKNGTVRYGAIPFVHGLFEFQVKRMDRELASLVRQYMAEEFKEAMSASAANFLRVVPVQKSIDQRSRVAPYEDAVRILEKAGQIVVTDCVCRKSSAALGTGCGKPLEVCFMFGSMGQYYLDHGMGRKIDLPEAVRVLADAHDHGLVTQPATSQNPSGMCNCCGDCCGPLTSLKHHPKPAGMVFTNYFARVDEDLCTGCETCLERCQMDAIGINAQMSAHVDPDRCIGCGLCVTTCPTEAMHLEKKQDGDFQVPPETTFQQMMNMAKNRGIV
jgi:electron transport complex protein RnfB